MEEEIAESPVLRVFASAFGRMRKNADHADAAFGCSNASHNLSRYVLLTRACRSRPSLSLVPLASCCRSHTDRAFCRICIFANTSEFSKISADDQNPSAHTYPMFFLMQCRFAVFAINPPQKSNAFFPPCGRNTRPIVLSVFFF